MTAMKDTPGPQIEVRNLKTYFYTEDGVVRAVDGIDYVLGKGRTLGLVGESGCGKSVSALSVMRLISPPGRIVEGEILLDGLNLLDFSAAEMRQVRGNRVSMIFQEPMTSLNPVFTIGNQIIEAIRVHQQVSRSEARQRTIEMLRRVKISAAETRIDEYPHQMSGGMRQRVMIAMALACDPEVLIADEPTTALDVTIQAQIMELLAELQSDFQMSILLITHNLGLVAEVADDIAVMYASKVVEYTTTHELFASPLHPYTHGLLTSVPTLGMPRDRELNVIPGQVPNPLHFPSGCKFHPRCPLAEERCKKEEPPLREVKPGHWAACHVIENGKLPLSGVDQ
ncbi:ABC transporter ATP-binding protein [Acidobacteria bacterium AH-259-D05]|nr:ABC transporter ATP-binding protein [Acidobacteria bacterium AH-259-D05]